MSQNSLKDNELIEQWRPSPHSYVSAPIIRSGTLAENTQTLSGGIDHLFSRPCAAPSPGQAGMEAEGGRAGLPPQTARQLQLFSSENRCSVSIPLLPWSPGAFSLVTLIKHN